MSTRSSRSESAVGGPVAIVLLVVAAIIVQQLIVVSAAVFVAALYVLARAWSARTTGRLEVVRRYPAHVFLGEETTVEVRIRNGSRLPIPWLRLFESVPVPLSIETCPAAVIRLGGHQEHEMRYTLRPRKRGAYMTGPLSIDVGDLLGMQDRFLLVPETEPIVVYPRIVPLDQLGLQTSSPLAAVPAPASLFEDTSQMVGVRDYRHGDSPRRMHWAAFAQSGRPTVKQFQTSMGRSTLLCLDLDPDRYRRDGWEGSERAITVAASLAYHIITREGQPAGLVTQGVQRMQPDGQTHLLPNASPAHLLSMLDRLARIQPARRPDFPQLVQAATARLPWGSSVILITGRPKDDLLSVLLQSRRRGHAVSVLAVQPSASGSQHAPSAGIPIHQVWEDVDLGVLQ